MSIKSRIEDSEFDDNQCIFRLDIPIIATGFSQKVDKRKIHEENCHPPIGLSLQNYNRGKDYIFYAPFR